MGWNVVLATDNEAIQHLFRKTFELRRDIHLTFCQTAAQTSDEIIKSPPHLLAISVNLPDKEGYELCRELKEQGDIQFPILLIEDIFEDIDLEKCVEVHTDGFIAKPFEEDLIAEKIDEVLNNIRKPGGKEQTITETPREETVHKPAGPEVKSQTVSASPTEKETEGILELTDLIAEDESVSTFEETAGFEEEIPPSIATALEESVSEIEKMEAMEAMKVSENVAPHDFSPPEPEVKPEETVSEPTLNTESISRNEIEKIVEEVVEEVVSKTLGEKLPQYLSENLFRLFADFSQSLKK